MGMIENDGSILDHRDLVATNNESVVYVENARDLW